MLNIKTRQSYLKSLGFYKGMVDGKEGPLTKNAYKSIQTKYFAKKYVDGIYGKQTDTVLQCAYNVWKYTKNFKLEEFRCECNSKYCTGYPSVLNANLLIYLQTIRNSLKVPMYITSGIRCQRYNDSLVGSIKGSKHIKGKAVDFYCSKTNSLTNRKSIINSYIKNRYVTYSYCDGYWKNKISSGYVNSKYMGTSIHIDVI